VHVRLTESLTRRTGHHLNPTVQDYFSSGIPGIQFYSLVRSHTRVRRCQATRTDSHHLQEPRQHGSDCLSTPTSPNPAGNHARQRKADLRRLLRRRRRALTQREQQQAARRLWKRVVSSSLFRFSRRIAFTIACDGEIDPQALLDTAWRRGKACYLPVLHPLGSNRLQFRRWRRGQQLSRGAYNIPVPPRGRNCHPRALSLVLLPLVGFDGECRRLGMGKGFYDRTFAFRRHSGAQSPTLLGLAHECQRVERLETDPWDLPLGGVATDQTWYRPGQGL